MRMTLPFNDGWLFLPEQVGDDIPDSAFTPIALPHSNKILPLHYFDNHDYQFVSTYRKHFQLPEPINDRRIYIDFDGAMIASTVSINGHTFEEYRGGYTPFSFDITAYLNENGTNTLTVHLDSTERADIPPYGYVVDYLTFGGIYRDVHLRYVEACHIHNVFVKPQNVLSDSPLLEIDVFLKNQLTTVETVSVNVVIKDETGKEFITGTTDAEIAGDGTHKILLQVDGLPPIKLWTLTEPTLYTAEITLLQSGELVDQISECFGFREATFRDDGFYLNGKLLNLRGLNRHQNYPYIGAAAPRRLQEKDADIVKFELGCNIVRTSHYPQSPHFLNRCDEIGLLVFEEIPGWQHIGDENWKKLSIRDVRAMIERDWNHPSIILWGVRINESLDETEFYSATNALARDLDPTRQTGGVRFWQHSEFLEDVFTFNDFSNGVEEPLQTPHLITEFNGHMFPTKTWDSEERVVEHALRHARIQDRQIGMGGVSGAIGWCAFDYNTHKEFGSGDRICYHGVMDIFRLPKYAAYVYSSQLPPEEEIVLQAATLWSMGDRSEGGNDPIHVFSNCEKIDVYVGEEYIGEFEPDRENSPYLPHPPFRVSGLGIRWGEAFGDLHILGYINEQVVAEQRIECSAIPHQLVLQADDNELIADGADMTRIWFKITDRYGNRLPYTHQVLTFEVDGPAELIGENPFALAGGQGALYLRTKGEAGTITVRASTPRLPDVEVSIISK